MKARTIMDLNIKVGDEVVITSEYFTQLNNQFGIVKEMHRIILTNDNSYNPVELELISNRGKEDALLRWLKKS